MIFDHPPEPPTRDSFVPMPTVNPNIFTYEAQNLDYRLLRAQMILIRRTDRVCCANQIKPQIFDSILALIKWFY